MPVSVPGSPRAPRLLAPADIHIHGYVGLWPAISRNPSSSFFAEDSPEYVRLQPLGESFSLSLLCLDFPDGRVLLTKSSLQTERDNSVSALASVVDSSDELIWPSYRCRDLEYPKKNRSC